MLTDLKDYHKDPEEESEGKNKRCWGEITVATPQTNANMKKELERKVISGEYAVGELITPRKV